jgi:predicted dehydrogenase
MRFLVTGCGSIGRRHIQNLHAIGDIEVVAHDISAAGRNKAAELFGIKTFDNYEDALAIGIDAVIVATPTNDHIQPALKALNTGCHLFMEKPVAHDLKDL